MNRRNFLKVLGIGGAVLSVAPSIVKPLTYEDRLLNCMRGIVSGNIHPIDGCLELKDLKDENLDKFKVALMSDEDLLEGIIDKCGRLILGDETKDSRMFDKLREQRNKIPLRNRRKPRYFS